MNTFDCKQGRGSGFGGSANPAPSRDNTTLAVTRVPKAARAVLAFHLGIATSIGRADLATGGATAVAYADPQSRIPLGARGVRAPGPAAAGRSIPFVSPARGLPSGRREVERLRL